MVYYSPWFIVISLQISFKMEPFLEFSLLAKLTDNILFRFDSSFCF